MLGYCPEDNLKFGCELRLGGAMKVVSDSCCCSSGRKRVFTGVAGSSGRKGAMRMRTKSKFVRKVFMRCKVALSSSIARVEGNKFKDAAGGGWGTSEVVYGGGKGLGSIGPERVENEGEKLNFVVEGVGGRIDYSFGRGVRCVSRALPIRGDFSVVHQRVRVNKGRSMFCCVSKFVGSRTVLGVVSSFLSVATRSLPRSTRAFSGRGVPCMRISILGYFSSVLEGMLSNATIFFMRNCSTTLYVSYEDCPTHNMSRPSGSGSLHNSESNFMRAVMFGATLVHEEVESPRLVVRVARTNRDSEASVTIYCVSSHMSRRLLGGVGSEVRGLRMSSLEVGRRDLTRTLFGEG